MLIVLAHDPVVPPGTLGTFLRSRAVPHRLVRLHAGDAVPRDLRRIAGIVSLGGTMSARASSLPSQLAEETDLLSAAADEGIPVLGICLGARLLARSLGGRVRRSPVPEQGWSSVSLTRAGQRDPLFAGLRSRLPAFFWHEDAFSLPPGAALLASSNACPDQAFRVRNAWGLQFHPEVDARIAASWSAGSLEHWELMRVTKEVVPAYRRQAAVLFGNFLEIVAAGRNT